MLWKGIYQEVNMRKTILLLAGIICLCGVLSGCSSNNDSTLTNDEQAIQNNISSTGKSSLMDDDFAVDIAAKEDGIYVYNEESQISEIALSFSLKKISPTGATLVFDQYDADSPKGELMFGERFVIEVLKNGEWEDAPITVDGNYGFFDIAYPLPCEEITEREIVWEWLYGKLEPGEYRIGKGVNDFIESGNYDSYMLYAHFILN